MREYLMTMTADDARRFLESEESGVGYAEGRRIYEKLPNAANEEERRVLISDCHFLRHPDRPHWTKTSLQNVREHILAVLAYEDGLAGNPFKDRRDTIRILRT